MSNLDLITLDEAGTILAARGVPISPDWLRRKVAAGAIDGAVKIGSSKKGTWLIPRVWAETYQKDTRGRPRKN